MTDLTYVFYVPGLPFNGDTLTKASLGGSETAGLSLARDLRQIGDNRVMMFCNTTAPGLYDGVAYIPAAAFIDFATKNPHDVCVIQRDPTLFARRIQSRLNVLHMHDLPIKLTGGDADGVMWNVDQVAVLSKFHKDAVEKVWGFNPDYLWQTRNGIDLELFKPFAAAPKNPKRMIYISRPERGLDIFLENIFPRILEQVPDATLAVCSYSNQVEHLREFYSNIGKALDAYGDRVEFLGNLNKSDLAREMSISGVFVYPGPGPISSGFSEISCIAAMEAQAAGLPIVTSRRGALPETIAPKAGTLIDGDASSPEYATAFARAVVDYMGDPAASFLAGAEGRKHAESLSWKSLAKEWNDHFIETIESRNQSPTRLSRHMLFNNDVIGAAKVLQGYIPSTIEGSIEKNELLKSIADHYPQLAGPDEYKEHYAAMGRGTLENLESHPFDLWRGAFQSSGEVRFKAMIDFITEHKIERALDAGCGHAWCDVYIHNKTGIEILGVDVDQGAVDWENRCAAAFANDPTKVRAIEDIGSDTDEALSAMEPFDLLICSEVLEHIVDPVEFIQRYERFVKPGGLVFLTVPYGPSESDQPSWNGFRNHLWNFDVADLNEIFGKKKEFRLHSVSSRAHSFTNDVIGFYVVSYRKTNIPFGEIDWDRRRKIQRPRQSLSVSMILGGSSVAESVHWALRSVVGIADEIVIADCGMDEEARRIVEQYPVRIVGPRDPLPPLNDWREDLAESTLEEIRQIQALLRLSDVEMALRRVKAWQDNDGESLPGFLLDHITDRWAPWSIETEAYEELYQSAGEIEAEANHNPDRIREEPRYPAVMGWFEDRVGEISHVLDYGCSRGLWGVSIANANPGLLWYGVDIDALSIEGAHKNREQFAINPDALRFADLDLHASPSTPIANDRKPFDALVVMEVLEHVPDPVALMDSLEARVEENSHVLITVPFGPVEFAQWVRQPNKGREHMREFTPEMIDAMFGEKKGVKVLRHTILQDQVLGLPMGYFVVTYLVDRARRTGSIADLPLRTVEVNPEPLAARLIGLDGVRSLAPLLDRVEVLNDGAMSDQEIEDLRLAGAWIVEVFDPNVSGFDACRNFALRECRSDWILWIDGDERVINPEALTKYLRQSQFDGFSIRQHHFTVDADFEPDRPVRLFRRQSMDKDGNEIRFFGMIHEHPEHKLNGGPGRTIVISDVNIFHIGYLHEAGRLKKFERNFPLLQREIEKHPDRLLTQHVMMRDTMILIKIELRNHGGRTTAKARDLAQQVVDIYRKYFNGENHYMNTDSLQYYSQAAEILGIGVDVAFNVSAEDPARGNRINGKRFASADDARREIAWRSKAALADFPEALD